MVPSKVSCSQTMGLLLKAPGRFRFNIRDPNTEFNHTIIVDIFYINGDSVLHVIDQTTRF